MIYIERAIFEIKQSATGNYYFTFKSSDGTVHIISCSFYDRAALEKCLSGVREAAPLADICACADSSGSPPFFWIQPKEDGTIFSLIGFNREVIFSSLSYPDEMQCRQAIITFKASSQKAATVDLTVE